MKRVKNAVIVFLVIAAWALIFLVLPKILEDKTLYLFGNFIAEGIFHNFGYLIGALICLLILIKDFKSYKIAKKIIYPVALCFVVVSSVYDIADTVNDFSAKKEINLPDGNKIILYEEDSTLYGVPIGAGIRVYEVKGIIAKYVGYCWESHYCDEYCLKENKWDYTYDETDKKLTLILKYDKPKDENGVGTRSEEFILE